MSRRNIVFANDQIYHIYNRSIAREQIFHTLTNLKKAKEVVAYYRYPQPISLSTFNKLNQESKDTYTRSMKQKLPLVEIYTYAYMPNHYHFLLKQLSENGISRFIANFQNSFAKYTNIRSDRSGSLFTNPFKAKWVENDELFIHISRYIHLNPVTAYIIPFERLSAYPWTSFREYRNGEKSNLLNTSYLLSMFQSLDAYISFVADQVDFQRTLAGLRDLIIE